MFLLDSQSDTFYGPARPTMARGVVRRAVVVRVATPESRSIPAELGTTDPSLPVAPARQEEHPQSMTLTDASAGVSPLVDDPTHPF
jgi:hypothetical protein